MRHTAGPIDLENTATLIAKARQVVSDENEPPVTRALAQLVLEAHDEYMKLDQQIRDLRRQVDEIKSRRAAASPSQLSSPQSLPAST